MSPRPRDMGPADLAPNTAPPEYLDQQEARIGERNWFYNSLSIAAKDRFLDALASARERGLDEDAAWAEAVRAAETTYVGGDLADDDVDPDVADVLDDERVGP